ncbi:flagella synthesis protein FlgN [Massilia sp. TWP1-3-3]|uniref:flagella synthesis protein FlgN n=1 Tax=Massilia sp. TWP1-3-3 TaxID=2804573 RepID=UPI003CEDE9F8
MSTASAHTTLQDELKLINCLIDLMKQEQQCLVAADTDGLGTLTPRKTELVEQLGTLAAQRHASLQQDGCDGSEAGMQAWVKRLNNPAIQANWQHVLEKMRAAKELNRINGMLINKQMTHNQNLIQAMRTPSHAVDTGFYGPSGHATPVSGKRPLVVG